MSYTRYKNMFMNRYISKNVSIDVELAFMCHIMPCPLITVNIRYRRVILLYNITEVVSADVN